MCSEAKENWENWTLEELEKQMSPSHWNRDPRKNPDEVVPEFINLSLEATNEARRLVPCTLNVPYGNAAVEKELYDIYGNNLPDTAPIFFWIHGGYWQESSKDISGLLAPILAKNGFKHIVFGYTLCPEVKIADIQAQLKSGLRKAMQAYPKSKFIVGGHSAGAHLSASLLSMDSCSSSEFPEIYEQLVGLVLVSGVYDLRPLVPTHVNDALKMDMAEATSLSPLLNTFIHEKFVEKGGSFKILVTVGEYDSPEFKRQSKAYAEQLRKSFKKLDFWLSPIDDHFTIVLNMMKNTKDSAGGVFEIFLNT